MTIALYCGVALAGRADAQAVRGQVLGFQDSTGVPGVIVQLLDARERTVAQSLSAERGRFLLRASSGGSYRLKALRIGYRPSVSPPFEIPATGFIEQSLVLTGGAVTLAATQVVAASRCGAQSDSGSLGFLAWEEARKALMASLLTRRAVPLDLDVVTIERQSLPTRDSVLSVREHESETQAVRPFTSVDVQRLARFGYVARDSAEVTYFAPDEEVLLSEEFGTTHCIHAVVTSADADSVVLAFSPTPERAARAIVDIEGQVVLARSTRELRRLSFTYVGLPELEASLHPGGVIHFRRLPDGDWIVDDWSLRLPVIEQRAIRAAATSALSGRTGPMVVRSRVTAMQETGGSVLRIRRGGTVLWSAEGATLDGVVRDSANYPVVGASVSIPGRRAHVLTDSAGRFRQSVVSHGAHLIEIAAPYADSLMIPATQAIASPRSGDQPVVVRIATRAAALAAVCPLAGSDSARGFVRGVIRDRFGSRQSGVDITVLWNDGKPDSPSWRTVAGRSTSLGDFAVCGVPLGRPLVVDAVASNGWAGRNTAQAPRPGAIAIVDVTIAAPGAAH